MAPLYTPPNVFGEEAASELGISSISSDEPHVIPNSYIVVMKEGHGHRLPFHVGQVERRIKERLSKRGLFNDIVEEISHHIDIADFKGYTGKFTEETLNFIRSHPAVAFVEKDSVVKAMEIENGAPWGLARISHRAPLRLSTLGKYEFEESGGEGVDAYIIDTGISINHVDFHGRAKWGKTMPQNDVDEDGNGHGTHVAGTIGSKTYGVAKSVNLIAVKVLGSSGSGSMSDVVGGVAWAASSASKALESAAARNGTHKGSVANMSLGGGKSAALDLAVNNAVKKGLHFAVAAGNDNRDACSYSPAAAENAITVGASTIGDDRAYFSNYGKCVDIFAPGLNILSTWNGSPRATNKISGTSMATPHIAGLTAYYLSLYPSGQFSPSAEDYAAAGVPVPGSAEERELEERERSLIDKGRQLVFGDLFGKAARKPTIAGQKPLDPKVLKKAMLRLATKGALSQLPDDGTPNLLAFNNYTKSSTKMEEEMVFIQPIEEKVEEAIHNLEEMVEEILAEDLAWLTGGRKE
ncbi:hypothetical protein P389DRAFT_141798 [Cystobasidium minutum MCA 4210]|uniref:uncharacterized protein n=1 Tax=Cystobasidium minutum MCA 4210 TaxID=1397322 RepID=UPI0034CD8869|eukprot:jgi/Rhomi1/141798/e_gw1.2.158.1